MPARTTITGLTGPGFVADHGSEIRSNGGRQVDWAQVPAGATYGVAGKRHIPAGTVMSELASGKVVPRAVGVVEATVTVPASFIAETAMDEEVRTHAISGYGMLVGGHLYENLLPEATGGPPATLPAAHKTELDNAGRLFIFSVYEDNRGS